MLAMFAGRAIAGEPAPPLPAPHDAMEPRQAERSGYAPQGARFGGLLLHADARIERRARLEFFDAAPEYDTESWQTALRLDLSALAGSDRWAGQVSGGLEVQQGSRGEADDTVDGHVGMALKGPLGRAGVVKTDLTWRQTHEPRTVPAADGYAATPTRQRTAVAGTEVLWRPGRLFLDVRMEAGRLDFKDTARLGFENNPVAAVINNDDRDRDRLAAGGRLGWELGALSSVYVRGAASMIDYHAGRDDFGFDRDSTGTAVFAGITLGRPQLWRAFAEVGRVQRRFDSVALPDVNLTAVNGGLTWATTPLMTNQLRLYTTVGETTEPFAPVVVIRGVELETEHELLRSLVLTSTLGAAMHDYPGPLPRTDISLLTETGARWRLGRLFRVEAGFSRERLESPWLDNGYTVHEAYLRLGARF
jgi:hypothetical protein